MLTFKQIQLVGFKSFADKTTIPLSEGVTCIVGPNGCGKSNVADAIRWVLGEQSAKMMRGSQMLDVIFGGTEKRRMMAYCEVTLTFDNSKRVFDVDLDEIEMTRRLYRDGTSEYLLNREPSRMKVLTGLLHGAGAAKEGYSIIGQGRIEQIMNAKPEDRRSIFEEATGIVVFKARKAETERRLSDSRDNLFVHKQRKQEAERLLNSLKREAESALKYRELFTEMRSLEMNLYIARHDSAEIEKKTLSSQEAAILQAMDDVDKRAAELLEEYAKSRDRIAEADKELQDLNDRMRRYEVGIERKSGESRVYIEKANSVKAKFASAQEELAYSAKRIDEINKEIKRAEAISERNSQRIVSARADVEKLQGEIAELSGKISKYEFMTGEQRKKVLGVLKDLSEMRQNMGSLAAQNDLLKERLGEIEEDMNRVRDKRDGFKAEYEECIKRSDSIASFLGNENSLLEEAEGKAEECRAKIQMLLRQVYDAQSTINTINANLELYRALRDKFEGYSYVVKKLMSDSRTDSYLSDRIAGLIADVVSCDSQFEVAIETAFGGAMQNVITRTREDARDLIEYLKRTRSGQVTFLPIDAMKPIYEREEIRSAVKDRGALGFAIDLVKYDKKFENIIHHLLGNTLIVDNMEHATEIARRYPRAFRIVTLDGGVIATSGSMTGGFRRDNVGNLLANERKLKELEEALAVKKSFLSRADDKKKEYEAERDEAERELALLQNKLQSARVELAQLSEKQTMLMNSVNSAESEYAAYGQSVATLKERLKGLDSEYSGVSSDAGKLSAESDEASQKIDDISAQYDGMIGQRNKLSERLNSSLVEIASLESAVRSGAENVERLKSERAALASRIDKINADLPQIQAQIDDLKLQAERSALTAEEQAVVNDLRRRIEEITAIKSDCNERIKKIDAERLECSKNHDSLMERKEAVGRAVIKIDTEMESFTQRILETYDADYKECLKYKTDDFSVTGAPGRVRSLRSQISALGSINHNAVEEYDKQRVYFENMLAEEEDLEKAVNDLTVALDDIRTEMLKIFNEGFEVISENFKRTFKELFGGGKAELQLDYSECDDPLDAGVEIIACPPGKKLTKISLLSGGERALTAIAILFAIIGMRPMPFCVLDEIEAALDEANVARYARYLKKFAENTQFIVITHRKPTMESADTLFGVTMEEKGVSKIVSVKLSEVEQRLGGDTVQ